MELVRRITFRLGAISRARLDGKADKTGIPAQVGCCLSASTMRLDNETADRQTHAWHRGLCLHISARLAESSAPLRQSPRGTVKVAMAWFPDCRMPNTSVQALTAYRLIDTRQ